LRGRVWLETAAPLHAALVVAPLFSCQHIGNR
jgi:hypothetical protein